MKYGFVLHDILLESSTLEDVKKRLGSEGGIAPEGTASPAVRSLCYRAKDGVLFLFASGETGGGRVVTEISSTEPGYSPGLDHCFESEALTRAPSLENRIRVGVMESLVLARLGEPSINSGGKLEYRFEQKVGSRYTEQLTVSFYFSRNRRLQRIAVRKGAAE